MTVHYTDIDIIILGNAIVVDLSNTFPNIDVKTPHMTLLFNVKGFTKVELQLVKNYALLYYSQKSLSFTLSRWGRSSDLIHGQLYNFCQFIREKFSKFSMDARKPHVALRV